MLSSIMKEIFQNGLFLRSIQKSEAIENTSAGTGNIVNSKMVGGSFASNGI